MKYPKVKDILDVIQAENINVVELHYHVGKPTEKITLYHYGWNHQIGDYVERIYDDNFRQRLVKAIMAIDDRDIEIRVLNEE